MSIGSSIMNMFTNVGGATSSGDTGRINPTPPALPNSALPANPAAMQQPHQAPAGTVPNTSVTAESARTGPNGQVPADGTPGAPKAPLADFSDVWNNPTPVLDANGKPVAPSNSSYINIDPKKIMDAAKNTDFTAVIRANPELMKRVAAGGTDGQAAMMEAMNMVGQMALGQSATTSAQLLQTALQKQEDAFMARVPELLRKYTANTDLRSEDARFNNPAVKPIIEGLQTKLAQKYPQATPAEINTYAKQYLTEFAQTFAPAPTVVEKPKGSRNQETDWDALVFGSAQ